MWSIKGRELTCTCFYFCSTRLLMVECYSKSLYHPGKLRDKGTYRSRREMMCHPCHGSCRKTGSSKRPYVELMKDSTIQSALSICHAEANSSWRIFFLFKAKKKKNLYVFFRQFNKPIHKFSWY